MGLYQTIDRTFIGDFVKKKTDIISQTNPDKIYAENIRRFFGVSIKTANYLCKIAVRWGHFTEHTEYVCSNVNCQKILPNSKVINGVIKCDNCELRDEVIYSFNVEKLDKITFYRLVRNQDGN